MGYDLYITRADSHSENGGKWIETEEWNRIVEEDTELSRDDRNGPHFAVWSGPTVHGRAWFEGNVYTKNPDSPVINKMVEIARKLGAAVRGEEGEVYTGGEEGFVPPPEYGSVSLAQRQQPWWRRLLRG